MAVVDEKEAVPLSSAFHDSSASVLNEIALSPEDIAWIDSCLIKDPQVPDGDWSSLKDVLCEILSLQPEQSSSSVAESVDFPKGMDIDMQHSSKAGKVQTPGVTNYDFASPNRRTEIETDWSVLKEETSDLSPQLFWGDNPEMSLQDNILSIDKKNDRKASEFVDLGAEGVLSSEFLEVHLSETSSEDRLLSTFEEPDHRPSLPIDAGFDDLDSLAFDLEPSTDGLFEVWDLEIPTEEDDFMKQLNKALSRGSAQSTPSNFRDPGILKDLSVDDLVAGIAGMTLNHKSS